MPAETGLEEVADRLVVHAWVDGEDFEKRIEPLARRVSRIQEDLPLAANGAGATRQVTERFLADAEAEIPCQLHRLFEEAEGV